MPIPTQYYNWKSLGMPVHSLQTRVPYHCWLFSKCQVYEDLRYKLSLEFPSGYPYNAPTVKFLTPCYHPNVDTQGNICLDILKDKWSALYDVRTILLSIQSLLGGKLSPLHPCAQVSWEPPDSPASHSPACSSTFPQSPTSKAL